jgi:phage protein D
MRISAKTSNAKMRRAFSKMTAPKSFSWHEYLLQDIVFAIATLNGFDQAMVDKSLQGIFIKHLDQSNESDIALLQRLAQDLGAFIKAVDNVLIFSHRRRAVSVTGKPMPQTNLTRQDITSYNMTIAERGKYGKVIAKWHDFTSGEEMKVEAGQDEPAFTIRHTFANKQRAKLAVNARLEEFTHGSQSLELAIIGNPNITAESLVNLQGLSHKINGKWVVMSITHDFTNSGYTCDLSCQKPVDVTPLLKGE